MTLLDNLQVVLIQDVEFWFDRLAEPEAERAEAWARVPEWQWVTEWLGRGARINIQTEIVNGERIFIFSIGSHAGII